MLYVLSLYEANSKMSYIILYNMIKKKKVCINSHMTSLTSMITHQFRIPL